MKGKDLNKRLRELREEKILKNAIWLTLNPPEPPYKPIIFKMAKGRVISSDLSDWLQCDNTHNTFGFSFHGVNN